MSKEATVSKMFVCLFFEQFFILSEGSPVNSNEHSYIITNFEGFFVCGGPCFEMHDRALGNGDGGKSSTISPTLGLVISVDLC